jgi:hypothetical protein
LQLCEEAKQKGQQIFGAALLNDDGKMMGTVMVFDMPDRKTLDAHLAKEPYISGNVWQTINVYPCSVGQSFKHVFNLQATQAN